MPLRRENRELTLAFEQYREFVRRSLVMHGVESADVDDATQQVFLVTYRRLDDYRQVDKKVPWLFVVSKLVAQNYRRALRRSRARALRYLAPPPTTLEETLLQRAAARELELVLERLDERDRAVFLHADMEGLSAREIAAELRMNVNTVYTRLRSARQQFALGLRLRFLREGAPNRSVNPRKCS